MASAAQFVPTPEAVLLHPECARCGECLFCSDPHDCPADREHEPEPEPDR